MMVRPQSARSLMTFAIAAGTALAIPAVSGATEGLDLLDALRPSIIPEGFVAATMPASTSGWLEPALNARNGFLVLHLVGLCLGLGGTFVLDALLLQWILWGRPSPGFAPVFKTLSHTVLIGLLLLWISGLGFLAVYALGDAAKLFNPKLHVKIAVVCVLSINGAVLHRWILPLVQSQASNGRFLAGYSPLTGYLVLLTGAISAMSWITAFLLGVLRELNGRAGFAEIVPIWLSCIALASLASFALLRATFVRRPAAGGSVRSAG